MKEPRTVLLAATHVLTLPDYLVVAVYLLGTLGLGLWIGRRMKTGADFFLGGRTLPWWAIGMSLVATDIGGTDIIGVGGAAYSYGLAVANFEWIGCVPAMIVGAFVFIPFFYRAGVYTIPEFLERRYNLGVRTILATCWLLFMACNLGIMLLASAKMMSGVFGWNVPACMLATAALVGMYTISGGLAAVVYTDTIQCTIMIAGCLLILVLGLIEVGGVAELKQRIAQFEEARRSVSSQVVQPAGAIAAVERTNSRDGQRTAGEVSSNRQQHTALILPADTDSPFPWPGIYFGLALILSPAYWIGNQAIVQRSLGARTEFEAKAAYVWGALLKNVIPIIVAVPGLIALALLPELEDGDAAIPSLVGMLLPVGVRGLFVAAFLAALMSSIDSYLNSAATIVTHDFYQRFRRQTLTDAQQMKIGRISTAGLVAWALSFGFLLSAMEEGSGIYAIFQTLMAFFQGPAFAVLLIGVVWKRATGPAAVAALLTGIATSIMLYALNQPAVFQWMGWQPLFQISEPFLYFSIWAFLVTAGVLAIGSLLTAPPADRQLRYVLGQAQPASSGEQPAATDDPATGAMR